MKLILIKLDNGSSLEAKANKDLLLAPRDYCVFKRDFYLDIGEIIRIENFDDKEMEDLPEVLRKADLTDIRNSDVQYLNSKKAMSITKDLVQNLKLDMKLLNAHYSLDGKQIVIQFSADGRVDFRELVKELSRSLQTRIELRQIGIRDETSIHGGIAPCGQQLCCSRFLKEFSSINVKMAKDQELALTPSSVSGTCGRLKCCLKFEHEGYIEMERGMPRRGDICETDSGKGRIIDRNLLTQRLSVSLESGNIVQLHQSEVKVVPREQHRAKNSNKPQKNNNANKGKQPLQK